MCIFVLLVLALLQLPYVQTRLAGWATQYLSQQLGYPLHVGYVSIRWFDTVVLEQVSIRDSSQAPMIYVEDLKADFDLRTLIQSGRIFVDEVTIDGADVQLVIDRETERLNINGFVAAINNLTRNPNDTTSGKSVVFQVGQVHLNHSRLLYADRSRDSFPEGFNYYHMQYDSIRAEVADFRIARDTVEMQVDELQTFESNAGVPVHQLKSFFRYCSQSMDFLGLNARIGDSYLGDTLRFTYDSVADLSDFVPKVNIDANLENTIVYAHDLALFAPAVARFQERVMVRGKFSGTVDRFRIQDMNFYFGDKSYLFGSMTMMGLPAIEETFIELNLSGAQVDAADIRQYIPNPKAYAYVARFGTIRFNGSFLGFPNDFVADGFFNTGLGDIQSDLNLKINEDPAESYYRGELATFGLDIGTLYNVPRLLQKLDMSGWIEGTGFLLENANDSLNATISRLGINGYNYRNIAVDAQLSREQFRGDLRIADPNLEFTAAGLIDLRDRVGRVDISARIDTLNLDQLGLVKGVTLVQSDVELDFEGLRLNDMQGDGFLRNVQLVYQDRVLTLDSLHVTSLHPEPGLQRLSVVSDLVDADFAGDFEIEQVVKDLQRLTREYGLIFQNDAALTERYYQQKKKEILPEYSMEYGLLLKDVNPITRLFVPNFYLSPATRVEGNFFNGNTSVFTLNTTFDTLVYNDNYIFETDLDVTSSKIADSSDVLASIFATSRRQEIHGIAATENFLFDGTWSQKQIEFRTGLEQENSTNLVDLNGTMTFRDNRSELHFQPSHFQIIDHRWEINPDNLITIWQQDSIYVRDLTIAQDGQQVGFRGLISRDRSDSLLVVVREFDLANLNSVVNRKFGGTLNAYASLSGVLESQELQGNVQLRNFMFEDFMVGQVYGESAWDDVSQRLNVNLNIDRDNERVVRLAGFYKPEDEENQLNLTARLEGARLAFLETIIPDISNVAGMASGSVRILGMLSSPLVLGNLDVTGGRFRIDYLNTTYRFEDKVYFSENQIGVSNLELLDENGNRARLTRGGLFHDGFRDFVVSLQGELNNFQVLNTTYRDNKLYYGVVNVTGSMEIFGPFSDIVIRGDVRTERDTKLFIPVEDENEVAQSDYINFINVDSLVNGGPSDTIQLSNLDTDALSLNFNIDVTPEAYGEIIFDRRAGDIIRANGEGRISMVLDRGGDFSIFGQYTITRGRYNFTMLNLINKEFVVEPGGTITWNGDPLQGIMNIQAIYEQVASFQPLANGRAESDLPAINRRYPVDVQLVLQGVLLNPQIKLGIDFPENSYPSSLSRLVLEFEALTKHNEQELNRQVFGLLVMRSLLPTSNVVGGIDFQTGTVSSISELLSNQVSYYFSQIDDNLEVDIDLNGFDEEALNTLQLRLSYTALGGRLRFTRDGSFTNSANQATTLNVIGDITVEYSLTADNKLRLKMFSRTNQNLLTSGVNSTFSNGTTQGFSFLHTQSFNKFHELLPRGFREKLQDEDENPPPVEGPDRPQASK